MKIYWKGLPKKQPKVYKKFIATTSLHHKNTKIQNKRNTTSPPSPMAQPI